MRISARHAFVFLLPLLVLFAAGATLIRKEQIEDAYVRNTSDAMSGTLTVPTIQSSTGTNTFAGAVDVGHYVLSQRANQICTLQNNDAGELCVLDLFARDGDLSDDVYMEFFALGTPSVLSNRELLQVGWSVASSQFEVTSKKNGTGVSRPIVLYVYGNSNQLRLNTDGSVSASGSTTFGDAPGDTTTVAGMLYGGVVEVGFSIGTEASVSPAYMLHEGIQCSGSRGYVAKGNGSIVAVSGWFDGTNGALEIRKNGTNVWSFVPGASGFSEVQAKGTDTFVAGDHIEAWCNTGTHSGQINVLVTLDSMVEYPGS